MEFKNQSFLDFSQEEVRNNYQSALENISIGSNVEYPLVINGEKIFTEEKINSINPSNFNEILGSASKASKEEAERAMIAAENTFPTWSKVPAKERAEYLNKAAEIMLNKRYELAATLTLEVGKSWREADADVSEAIDFLKFYAMEMLRIEGLNPVTPFPGEENQLKYIPLGVGIVISPWNFPFAILCGMTAAAIVTGNTVVLKPASNAPIIGYKFMEIMEEANLPAGVINFVVGSGSEIGDYLVEHPKTRFISYTGSKEVGLRIIEKAAKPQEGQFWIKRVSAEMGGKDAIIVDKDVDIKTAVQGVAASAFGFSGQKCSACSRAIIHQDIYDEFLGLLKEETEKLSVGPVVNYENYTGPVIDKSAYDKVLKYIEIGKSEGRLITGGNPMDLDGYFIEPTIFADIAPKARIAQEEIFGPVLAVTKAKDFDEAIELVNNTEYGLTGAVYSNNQANIEKAKEDFHVGNLYFNRGCTGAMVGAHPFGGFNMSGTCSKAGGQDYLQLFLQAKSMSQKI